MMVSSGRGRVDRDGDWPGSGAGSGSTIDERGDTMMALEINKPRQDRGETRKVPALSRNLVLIASGPSWSRDGASLAPSSAHASSRPSRSVAGPNGLYCTRLPAHAVGSSAAWWWRISHGTGISPRFAEPFVAASGDTPEPPVELSDALAFLNEALGAGKKREAIAEAMIALREADAVIAGPLATEDANAPGLLPHLADLASQAYRALRPPRELVVHPAFAQIARRFHFIQMTHNEARALGAGAVDINTLAQQLRRLQGDTGEFAITSFASRGLLWADHAWWEIEPIGNVDESAAGAVFCVAWVVSRRFRHAGAAQALAYARAATAAAFKVVAIKSRGLADY